MYSTDAGVFLGKTLLQRRGEIGGARYVFVKLQGNKNELVFPTFGCKIMNPFKGTAKMYAGDLIEYRYNDGAKGATGYILKTYVVNKATSTAADTVIYLTRDGYKHIPFVGDVLMKAPATIDGTGTAVTVTKVEPTVEASKDVWEVTLSATLADLVVGDILVEAVEAGSGKKPMVTNPNAMCPADYDFLYEPATGDADFDGARYFMTPVLHGIAYIDRMSPMPKTVLDARNKSLVTGWFEL
jgi:hypothetical protein